MRAKRFISLFSAFLVFAGIFIFSAPQSLASSTGSKDLKIGLNVFANDFLKGNDSYQTITNNGKRVDYVVCHFDPDSKSVSKAISDAKKVKKVFEKDKTDFIANFEFQNFNLTSVGSDGYSWVNNDNGCHSLKLPKKYLKELAASKNCKGIMLDEFEHAIVNRNASIQLDTKLQKVLPVFPLKNTKDAYTQGEYLTKQLKSYVKNIKSSGIKSVYGEHVMPVLYHKFAESGIVPNFKSQKESSSDIQYAVAAGAALQYGTPLSTCIDNWYFNEQPGHSADEMYYNFVFAYYAGVNEAYTESVHVMTENEDGKTVNDYGNAFIKFSKKYKPKTRTYDISDYRPEIGIIRYDDTYYGQWLPVVFKNILFGNNKIKPDYRSKEYLKIFNLITHGESPIGGLTADMLKPASLLPHRSFVSLNSTAVFDHKVTKKTLDSLKLCFLTGIYISDKTISDVQKCVRENGMTVVTTKRFAPKKIADKVKGGFCEIKDGKGKWVVINSYSNPSLKAFLKPYIGKKGEMRFTFKNNREVIMKITNNGNSFKITKK